MTTIAILGSGVMASALTVPLAENGHDIRLVGTHLDRDIIDAVRASGVHPGLRRKLPAPVRPYQVEQIDAAFDGAEIVVSGVSSLGIAWAGQRLARLLTPGMLVIAIAKGMAAGEDGDLRILPDVLAEQVPAELRARIPWAAIAGPSIAGRWRHGATPAWSSPAATRTLSTAWPPPSAPAGTTCGPPPTWWAWRCAPR
jgi:glycerol-3-phosphate dehydrogenase (NAD(P)+)